MPEVQAYEIAIGAASNTVSYIKRSIGGSAEVNTQTPSILHCTEARCVLNISFKRYTYGFTFCKSPRDNADNCAIMATILIEFCVSTCILNLDDVCLCTSQVVLGVVA